MVLFVLYSDDLGLDWWSLVLYWGCVGLVVKMWLVRHCGVLPSVKGQVLSGFLMWRAVHSLMELWLELAIVRVMRNWLGVRLWLSVVGVVGSCPGTRLRFPVAGIMCRWRWVQLRLHRVLLWWRHLLLRHGGTDGLPQRDDWPTGD